MRPSSLWLAFCLLAAPAAAADRWEVRPSESRLGFEGTVDGKPFSGRFERFACDIAFTPEDLAGSSVRCRIDVTSFASGSKDRDSAVPGADWFDAARVPAALFETKGFRALGANAYEADAALTIKDTTRDVVLAFRLEIAGASARMTGGLTLDRLDYGLGAGDWASDALVGHKVAVGIELVADRR